MPFGGFAGHHEGRMNANHLLWQREQLAEWKVILFCVAHSDRLFECDVYHW